MRLLAVIGTVLILRRKVGQEKRRFPHGAVLVKKLLQIETMAMTTGPAVGKATTIKGCSGLLRDTKCPSR